MKTLESLKGKEVKNAVAVKGGSTQFLEDKITSTVTGVWSRK